MPHAVNARPSSTTSRCRNSGVKPMTMRKTKLYARLVATCHALLF